MKTNDADPTLLGVCLRCLGSHAEDDAETGERLPCTVCFGMSRRPTKDELRDEVRRLLAAIAAARREGAEAMREACVRACEDDAASLDAQAAKGNVRSAAKSAEARFIASLLRALPLPEVTP